MKVGRNSDEFKVAGAIASRVRDNRRVAISSIGPDSVFKAVKALAVARQFLVQDNIDISFKPEFMNVTLDEGVQSTALRFVVLSHQF